MARYNPKNKQHRKTLAKRITKMLEASDFSVIEMEFNARVGPEVVYRRDEYIHPTLISKNRSVEVYTTIYLNEMSPDAHDIEVWTNPCDGAPLVKIPCKGDMDGITARLLRGISKARKVVSKKMKEDTLLDLDFKVGELILHSSMNRENGENWKGMCKAVNEATRTITIFWFHSGETSEWPLVNLRPLRAA
jgi:hypothetical protein